MRKLLTIAALLAVFASAPIHAADLGGKAVAQQPAEPRAVSRTGCYFGVHAGVVSQSVDIEAGGANIFTLGLDGTFIGGQAGCDAQAGRIVGGLYGEYNFFQAEGENAFLAINDIELDSKWSLGLRLGFLLNQHTLLYGKAAFTKAKGDNNDLTGWDFGGGLELDLTRALSLQLDYTGTKWNDDDNAFGLTGVTAESLAHAGRIGLIYRFGANNGINWWN
jgi:opacity protein-like surface antigen